MANIESFFFAEKKKFPEYFEFHTWFFAESFTQHNFLLIFFPAARFLVVVVEVADIYLVVSVK